jgi:hypothetical protein
MNSAAVMPEMDLLAPREDRDAELDPYTICTYYFEFCVPTAGLKAYIYLRFHYAFGLSQGGVVIFRGLHNTSILDAEYHDYRSTMPWPVVHGGEIRLASGMVVDVLEPGRRLALRYTSPDGHTMIDVEQTAVTPLVPRASKVNDDVVAGRPRRASGGFEQIMRCTGTLGLAGEQHEVDCNTWRDRSLFQQRSESPLGHPKGMPPLGWSTIACEGFALTHMGFEPPETEPAWADVPSITPPAFPLHGWTWNGSEVIRLAKVRRQVHERHPVLHAATAQTLYVVDEAGGEYRIEGEAVSMAPVHCWPNIEIRDSLYRWSLADGRVVYGDYQEGWYASYQRAMKARTFGIQAGAPRGV